MHITLSYSVLDGIFSISVILWCCIHHTFAFSITLRLSLCVPFLPSVSSQLSLSFCITSNSLSSSVKVEQREAIFKKEKLHKHTLTYDVLQNNLWLRTYFVLYRILFNIVYIFYSQIFSNLFIYSFYAEERPHKWMERRPTRLGHEAGCNAASL